MILSFLLLISLLVCSWVALRFKNKNAAESKLAYLEGARGIAAFIVVIYHILERFLPAMVTGREALSHNQWEQIIATSPLYALYSGTACVAFFFVLSGFVLSYGYFTTRSKEKIVSSASKRYLRLAIPVLFTNLLYFQLMGMQVINPSINTQMSELTFSSVFLNEYTMQLSFLGMLQETIFSTFFTFKASTFNSALWTMAFEFYGSAIVFSLLWLIGHCTFKFRAIGYFIAIMIILLFFKQINFLGFLTGLILCDLYVSGFLQKLNLTSWKVLLLVFGFYLISFNDNLGPKAIGSTWYSWILNTQSTAHTTDTQIRLAIIIGATCLLALLLLSKGLQRFLSSQVCLFLGKISFSLYLSHYLVLYTFSCWILLYLSKGLNYLDAVLISVILSFFVMIAVAYLCYFWIDRFAVTLSSTFYRLIKTTFLINSQAPGSSNSINKKATIQYDLALSFKKALQLLVD